MVVVVAEGACGWVWAGLGVVMGGGEPIVSIFKPRRSASVPHLTIQKGLAR